MKRGYFVYGCDESWGVAVVAPTGRQARNIAYTALHNLHEGLLRGFYMYIEGKCDECSDESQLELCSGKALCFDCMEKAYKKEGNKKK
jgi:hypothetical protein